MIHQEDGGGTMPASLIAQIWVRWPDPPGWSTKEKDADSASRVSQPTMHDAGRATKEITQDGEREGSWLEQGTFEQKVGD